MYVSNIIYYGASSLVGGSVVCHQSYYVSRWSVDNESLLVSVVGSRPFIVVFLFVLDLLSKSSDVIVSCLIIDLTSSAIGLVLRSLLQSSYL